MNRRIGQIALVVSDQARSTAFYARAFGLEHVFGTSAFRRESAGTIQGIDNVASTTHWLIDDRELFQLEIFQFEHPRSRPLPEDHSICDDGYNRVIIAVKSLQETSERVTAAGGVINALLFGGQPDCADHALVRDPDGILLELVEAPELVPGERPARIIGLGITSPDLATTVEDMCEGFGFTPCEDRFRHGTFWQADGRLESEQTLQLDDMYLVVSQYRNSRARAADYRLADIGVMNFAICFLSQEDFADCYRRTQQIGMYSSGDPFAIGEVASVTYNNDRQGFSVKMFYLAKKLWGLYGFAHPRWQDRVTMKLMEWKSQRKHRKHIRRRAA